MIEAAIAVVATLAFFFPIFMAIFMPVFAARFRDGRAARLKELKKYSIRPLDLR